MGKPPARFWVKVDQAKERYPLMGRWALAVQLRSRMNFKSMRSEILDACRLEVGRVERARELGRPVVFRLSLSDFGPTFGDLMLTLMWARLVCQSGVHVDIVLTDSQTRRSEWMQLSSEQATERLGQFEQLARVLVADCPLGQFAGWGETALDSSTRRGALEVGFSPEAEGAVHPYMRHQNIFNVAVREFGWKVPEGFLLTHRDFPSFHWQDDAPFVAWHVRRGVWDRARNSEESTLLRDYYDLRVAYPNHPFVILSTPNGIDWALSALGSNGT